MPVQKLLDAIIANPHDDDARLVYADALTSLGDPRGEFIVIQVELARLGVSEADDIIELESDADLVHAVALWRRQQELLTEHELTWLNDTFGDIDFYERATFRRGFIDHTIIACDRDAQLLVQLEEQRKGPPIESLRISTGTTDAAIDLLSSTSKGSRSLRHLRTLTLDSAHITGASFERLVAGAPSLENLVGSMVPGLTPEILMRAPCLRALRSLNIGCRVDEFLDALVCPALEHVELYRGTHAPAGGGAPFDLGHLKTKPVPKIKTIRFCDDSRFAGDSVLPLLDSPLASTLESLELSGMGMTTKSIEAIGTSERLNALKKLTITATVEEEAFVAIARARSARLTKLHVDDVEGINETTLASLFATHASLRDLKLKYSSRHFSINTIDLLHTFAEHAPASLRSLSVEGFNLTNAAHVAVLTKAPQLSKLRRLQLGSGAMGNAGARVVSEAPMPNLVEIRLGANGIRGHGIRAFLNAKEQFPAITTLHLGVNGDTASYVALHDKLGDEVFRDKSEFIMPSGEPYWSHRDGSTVISHQRLDDKVTAKDIAEHLHAMKMKTNDTDLVFNIVKEDEYEVLIALSEGRYEGVVDPIALKVTRDQDSSHGEVRVSYFISDRDTLWPLIEAITKWLTTLPKLTNEKLVITDAVLERPLFA